MLVVPCPIKVGSVEKDLVDPVERFCQLCATSIHVEKGEGVDANDGVEPGPAVVEVGL
mgnify:FL=1